MDDRYLNPSNGPVIGTASSVGSRDNPHPLWMLDLANLSSYLAGIHSSNSSTPMGVSNPET